MNAPQLIVAGLLVLTPLLAAAQSRTNSPAPQTGAKSTAKSAPAPAPSPAASFDAFKNVPDRNIFNTRRAAGRTSDAPTPPTRRDPVIETFSLLGTLDYPKGPVAFFEGSSSGHRKAVQVDESIGGCKVTAIESSLVRLEANGKPVELKVGYMMRREDEGEWKAREAERIFEPTYTSSFSSSSGPSSPFGSGSSFGGSSSSRDSRSSSGSSSFGRDSRDSRGGSSSSNSRDSRGGSSSFGSGSNPADMAQQRIREQDRNGDGKISREEADSRLRDNFRTIDRNGDGSVDTEEYTTYYVSRFGGSSGGGSSSSGGSFNSGSPSSSGGSFNSGGSSNTGSSGTTGSSGGSSTSSTSSGGGGESDLLKRLMEQRSRENR